ncbi:MAG: membrane protein insertion efficiency factor YidD [Candidatus Margulisiibacteriota bacterium]|nr:membrane protein insertion efficiency factor YidD [Candidatus Margulisiibacteriota bacterium]
MAKIIKYLLVLYRKIKISPPTCRHYPSCSHYAEEAIERYGVLKGGYLALKRLIRCNRLFPGGYDPVP